MRLMAAKAFEMREQGLANAEIAKQLGYTHANSISNLLYLAGKNRWFLTPDIEDHLTFVTVHKIVKNVDKQLDGKDLTPQQQEMTIAAARGRGLFKNYEATKHEGPPASLVLGVKIEVVSNEKTAKELPAGGASGTPNYIEGQVV